MLCCPLLRKLSINNTLVSEMDLLPLRLSLSLLPIHSPLPPLPSLSLSLSLSLSQSQGFSAPSYDDKLVEVVGVTGITQVTTAKVLGIQNQRIAQCRYAKINIHSPDTLPMQVDGEAWLQEPGIIVVSHKNKARIIFKNKVYIQYIERHTAAVQDIWGKFKGTIERLFNLNTSDSEVMISEQSDWSVV